MKLPRGVDQDNFLHFNSVYDSAFRREEKTEDDANAAARLERIKKEFIADKYEPSKGTDLGQSPPTIAYMLCHRDIDRREQFN